MRQPTWHSMLHCHSPVLGTAAAILYRKLYRDGLSRLWIVQICIDFLMCNFILGPPRPCTLHLHPLDTRTSPSSRIYTPLDTRFTPYSRIYTPLHTRFSPSSHIHLVTHHTPLYCVISLFIHSPLHRISRRPSFSLPPETSRLQFQHLCEVSTFPLLIL